MVLAGHLRKRYDQVHGDGYRLSETSEAVQKEVEIVDEEELDTIRCALTDTECLNRAKAAGKKVEVTD